jgi:ankyrin repeat protein
MHSDPRGAELVPIIQLLIDRGAELNTVTPYGESALSVSSNSGRFDAVAVLLRAGADPAPLQWTSLMRAVALGSSDEVKAEIENGTDLAARDFWNRTAWLLSLQVGDIAKAKLLLAAGADRKDRGRCGKTPLMYPVINGHTEMLSWLLSERFDPNDVDKFGETPLMHAAEEGATESAKILIDAGAHIHRVKHSWAAIRIAINLDIVRLLVNAGADLSDISDETRAAVTKLPHDGRFRVSREEYFEQKHRRFGESNPQKMNFPFWKAMVTSGRDAYGARERFDDINTRESPVWCFRRFGKSITELPDGRVIEIAGEHEDGYDPEFCIYNDVIVHHGDGTFDIYGYPRELFPPTDFHTSTLVGKYIYIIGNLGYLGERQCGCTPVLRLDVESLEIERVETSGDNPGWISEHKATCARDGRIQIRGGKICQLQDGVEQCSPNTSEYVLDLATSAWTKIG